MPNSKKQTNTNKESDKQQEGASGAGKKKVSHDLKMKRLMTICFQSFIQDFYPEIAAELDFTEFNNENFLAEELFPEFKVPGLLRTDTVIKVKQRGNKKASIFVLVEAQRKQEIEFVRRMFKYFALLYIKFDAPIIPIAIYTDEDRWEVTDKWNSLKVEFAGYTFLDFRFLTLKPRNLSVKDYLRNPNPAVTDS
jgi:hypothetical protein